MLADCSGHEGVVLLVNFEPGLVTV